MQTLTKADYPAKYEEIRRIVFNHIFPRGEDSHTDEEREKEYLNNWALVDSMPNFIDDMEKVANGRPITSDRFIMALTMWEADAHIRSGIFSDCEEEVLIAIKGFNARHSSSVQKFVKWCLYPDDE